jgi:hypothetical protein
MIIVCPIEFKLLLEIVATGNILFPFVLNTGKR